MPRHLVGDVRRAFGAQLLSVFGGSETYVATCTRPPDSDEQLATDGSVVPPNGQFSVVPMWTE